MVQMWKQLFQINEKKTSQVQKLLQNLNEFSKGLWVKRSNPIQVIKSNFESRIGIIVLHSSQTCRFLTEKRLKRVKCAIFDKYQGHIVIFQRISVKKSDKTHKKFTKLKN